MHPKNMKKGYKRPQEKPITTHKSEKRPKTDMLAELLGDSPVQFDKPEIIPRVEPKSAIVPASSIRLSETKDNAPENGKKPVGANDNKHTMLRRMAESEHKPKDLSEEKLLHDILGVAKMLQMNEMEIAYWSLWLDTFEWRDSALDYKKLLRVTAFQIKSFLNPKEEVAAIYDKIAVIHHDFANQYNKWHEKTADELEHLKPMDANTQYKALIKPSTEKRQQKAKKQKMDAKFAVDYNKFVDDLLKLTPHNQNYPKAEDVPLNKPEKAKPNPLQMMESVAPLLQMSPPIQAPIPQIPSLSQPEFIQNSQMYSPPLISSQEELKRSLGQVLHSQFCTFYIETIIALTPSQDNMEQHVFASSGLSRADNIHKVFLDSQPMLLRGDSLVGNEEMGSFPSFLSAHQSLKVVSEMEPCPTPKFEGDKPQVRQEEDKKDQDNK